MRFAIEKFAQSAFALLVLAVLLVSLYIIVPVGSLRAPLGIAVMLLILSSGLLLGVLALSGIIEIVASKNGLAYKLLWVLVILSLNVLGYLLFYFTARKDLE